jgi:hypothetical protein
MPQSNIDLPILTPPQPQQGARDGKKIIMLVMGTVLVLSMGRVDQPFGMGIV